MTDLLSSKRGILFLTARIGIVLPYICRLLGVYFKGWGWLAPLAGDKNVVQGFLFLQLFNALGWVAIAVAAISYKQSKLSLFPIIIGFAALTYGYSTNDLTEASTVGLGVIYIPLHALPAVAIGWIIGKYYDTAGLEEKQPEKIISKPETDFDLEKTALVSSLFAVEQSKRDDAWKTQFFSAVRFASMAASVPQTFTAPDGMTYFRLSIPESGKPFTSFSLNHLLVPCTEEGHCGIAVFSSATAKEPEWVFYLGDLWSYRLFDDPRGDPQDLSETANYEPTEVGNLGEVITADKGSKFMTGTPSEQVLPPALAKTIADYMRHIGIADPSVALIVKPEWKPSRNLMFNIPSDKFDVATFNTVMENIAWMLPRKRGIMVYSDGFCPMTKLP